MAAAQETKKIIYAYCHGFLSNENSDRGLHLAKLFTEKFGLKLHLLNLNGGNDLSKLTFDTAFAAIDSLYEKEKGDSKSCLLRLIGCSFGGQTAASYAAKHPDRVESAVLLCPAIAMGDVTDRIVQSMNPDGLHLWKKEGHLSFHSNTAKMNVPVPFSFYQHVKSFPSLPEYKCPAVIIQGTVDDIVRMEDIKAFLEKCPEQAKLSQLVEVEDGHDLKQPETIRTIEREIEKFFNLDSNMRN